jgi:hypothetical protein
MALLTTSFPIGRGRIHGAVHVRNSIRDSSLDGLLPNLEIIVRGQYFTHHCTRDHQS